MSIERLGGKLLIFLVASWFTMLLFGVAHAELLPQLKPIDFGDSALVLGLWMAAVLTAAIAVGA